MQSLRAIAARVPLTGAALVALAGAASAGVTIGPSTSTSPYITPTLAGVQAISMLTVGDTPTNNPGYRMVGIPDGLGAFDNGDGTFTLLMNHELGSTAGVVRAHGSRGAFVSRWVINKNTLEVISGQDAITSSNVWQGGQFVQQTTAFSRFCSSDLARPGAFYNSQTGLGTNERIYLTGEETGNEGRAFGTIVTGANAGQAWELPWLGKFSWENALASPFEQDKTVVIGTDDSTPGQLYMYVGNKTGAGSEIERAGLTNGSLFGVQVAGVMNEGAGVIPTSGVTFHNFGNGASLTGAQLQTASNANSVTNFARPEDGHWNPSNPNQFIFCTTGASGAPNRLYSLEFTDITNPTSGATLTTLLDGTEGPVSMDNLTVDRFGNVIIQEDPGSSSRLAKIWNYNIGSGVLTELAEHTASFFAPGGANFLTTNEEASGIIDAWDILGDGWFLMDVQAHYSISGELVEGGQLLAFYNPLSVPTPGATALFGLAALAGVRRRR